MYHPSTLTVADCLARPPFDSTSHLPSLWPVSILTGAASGTVLRWHWWLHRAHPMHSGWKLNLAFSWSRIGGGGEDVALSCWQAGLELRSWRDQIRETSGHKSPAEPNPAQKQLKQNSCKILKKNPSLPKKYQAPQNRLTWTLFTPSEIAFPHPSWSRLRWNL